MSTERIDIMQEFVDLYKNEAMLAFFEFHLARAGHEPVRGLCRISKPKSHSAHMHYLSLTFMLDTPDQATRATADAALERLDGAAFHAALPAVADVVPVPDIADASENYIRQVDLMLADYVSDPGKVFIAERLLPALHTLTQITAGEVVWWDLDDDSAPAAPSAAADPSQPTSIAQRLKSYLGAAKK